MPWKTNYLIGGLLTTLLFGCGQPDRTERYEVVLRAVGDDGKALAGAELSIAGEPIGKTGEDGAARIVTRQIRGARVPASARCPSGYRTLDAPQAVTFRGTRALGATAISNRVPVRLTCAPAERSLAVVVRTNAGPGIGVLVNGKQLTTTDDSGVAHVLVRARPFRTVRISLDTSAVPDRLPRDPSVLVAVRDRDEIFLLDQEFAEKRPTRSRRRKRRKQKRPVPAQPRPVRIGATGRAALEPTAG